MYSSDLLEKISDAKMETYPFPHFLLEDYISGDIAKNVVIDLEVLEKQNPTSQFISDFGQKKEWKKFPEDLENLSKLLSFLGSEDFLDILKSKFEIPKRLNLYPDFSYDGGGYVISPPGSFLGYHADFNFSSSANMFRVINILIYLNQDYSSDFGGQLHLLDADSNTVEKIVSPKFGTMLGFYTDDKSFHGVSKNKNGFFRRSLNLYYYSETPISPNQSNEPHKTIWVESKTHNH